MADTVTVKFKVMEDGSLKAVGKDAERAAAGLDRASKSSDHYSKRNKGVAQAGMNSTKAFSKMTTGIEGGLVPAYATLAAHVFAVTAAFGVLSRSAAVKQLNEGLLFTGRAAGQNLPLVAEGLKEITENAVSTADALRAVALGTSAGFSEGQMEGLARVAKGASLALGRDMTDALDRLTRGAAKLEPEILDELGIMVRLDDATEKFAASIGKTAGDLSQFERRMAFTNAIIEQGEKKFGALSAAVESNPFNQLASTFDNVIKSVTGFVNTVAGPIAGYLANSLPALIATIGVLGTGVVNKMIPGLTQAGDAAADMAKQMAASAKETIANQRAFKGAPKIYANLVGKMKDGTASAKDMAAAQTSLTRSINVHEKGMDAFIEKHKKSKDAIDKKKKKLAEAKLALQQLTAAQKLETQATLEAHRADVLNQASAGNLRKMINSLKVTILAEMAATKASTLSKGMLSKALAIVSTSFRLAAFSAKAFGLALIQAIPIVGQIALVATLAYDAVKSFFSSGEEDADVLADVLEKNKKRLDEYPKILDQMAESYNRAETAAERYMIALRVQNGLLQQGLESVKEVVRAERVAAKEKEIGARRTLKTQKKSLEEAKKVLEQADVDMSKIGPGQVSKLDYAKTYVLGTRMYGGHTGKEVREAMIAYAAGLEQVQKAEMTLASTETVSYTHLTLPTKRIV